MNQNSEVSHLPWNKGRLIGPKPPLKPKHVWGIRIRLQLADAARDLAMFDLAIDSKLRGCDLVRLKIGDVSLNGTVRTDLALVRWTPLLSSDGSGKVSDDEDEAVLHGRVQA